MEPMASACVTLMKRCRYAEDFLSISCVSDKNTNRKS